MPDSISKPMYEKIYEAIRERIVSGQYKTGERVPSEKELCDEFSVSRITSKRALEMLTNEGYIIRQPGRGSFVNETLREPAAAGTAAVLLPERNRTGKLLIGLVITNFDESYGMELIYGMEEAARENHCFLVLRRTFGIQSYEEEAIQELLELGVDGMIIFPAQGEFFNAEILKLVISQFPFVLVDRYLKGLSASSISSDNILAAKEAAKYLFDLGHKHVAFITQPFDNTTAIEERIEGFIEAHEERGIVVERELWLENIASSVPNNFDLEAREKDIQIIVEHLRNNPKITAVFAVEYKIAELVFEAVERLQLSVPDDLSILCFDSPKIYSPPYFTYVMQNQIEMGRRAIESIIKLLHHESVPGKTTLPTKLVVGRTTAPPRINL